MPFKNQQPIPLFFSPHLDFPPVPVWRFLVSHLWRDPHQAELGDDSCSLCGQVRKTKTSFSEPLGGEESGPSGGICMFDCSGQDFKEVLGGLRGDSRI